MRIKELRGLSTEALQARLGELRLESGIERRKIASTGVQSRKGAKIREMKRAIAQIQTLLKERGVAS